MSSRPLLRVHDLRASWGPVPVLRGVSFDLGPKELLSLVGPNGAGKSTLLRAIAGLERGGAGTIELEGNRIEGRPAHRRGIGLVPQEPSLFPGRTVAENLAYAPRLQRRPEEEVARRVRELLELLEIPHLSARFPNELSGGEQQRVALGRALAAEPSVILLDEPFAAVDPEFRSELRGEFRRILAARATAAVHVTHDREEALFLGDRVGVMLEGRIEQIGAPDEVYRRPRTGAIARFLGYNLVPGGATAVAVDPHDLRLVPPGESAGIPMTVTASGTVGREVSLLLRDAKGTRYELRSPVGGEPIPRAGSPVRIAWSNGISLDEDPRP